MTDDVIKKFLIKIKGDEKMQLELLRYVLIAQQGTEKDLSDYLEGKGSIKHFNKLIDEGVKLWQS